LYLLSKPAYMFNLPLISPDWDLVIWAALIAVAGFGFYSWGAVMLLW